MVGVAGSGAWARWADPDRLGAVAVLVVGAAVRFALLGSPPFGEEAIHFSIARTLGANTIAVFSFPGYGHVPSWPFFLGRPAFYLLHAPGALVGFAAFRVAGVLVASLIPVLVFALVRDSGVRRPVAFVAGGVAALHPALVVWGARVFPDVLMAVLFLAALWAWRRGHPMVGGLFLVASAWAKEIAAVGVAYLLVERLVSGWRAGGTQFYPLELDRQQTALLAALPLGLVPLFLSLMEGGPTPGWYGAAASLSLLEAQWFSLWLVPVLVVGVAWRAARVWSLRALVFPAFFAIYGFAWGRAVDPSYLVLPAALTLVAVAMVVEEALRRAQATPRTAARPAAVAIAAALALLLVAQIVVPAQADGRRALEPASEPSGDALAGAIRAARQENRDLVGAAQALPRRGLATVFLMDVEWYYLDYPLAEHAGNATFFASGVASPWGPPVVQVAHHVEQEAGRAVVFKPAEASAFNRAFLAVYSDCIVYESSRYAVLDVSPCAGRADTLADRYEAERGGSAA